EWTLSNAENNNENLVFVNAWNEWAEGAHLEPDFHNGYAYLESTRIALLKAEIINSAGSDIIDQNKLAIVIHAFYIDILVELLDRIKHINKSFKIYVTTVAEHEQDIHQIFLKYRMDYFILVINNRGRDILPLIKIIPYVVRDGFKVVLKIHTKSSKHTLNGDAWRKGMINSLTNPPTVDTVMNCFSEKKDIGIIGPENYSVPLSTHIGSNYKSLINIAYRIGIKLDSEMINNIDFFAGTMFYFRISALAPILNLRISEENFDIEKGQIDGTLAHTLERAFSLSAISVGQKIISTQQMIKLHQK
ncbi:MAG: glycoside hydrolase family 99-like domain-containing protein, partial [Legionellales bacterium]|nr:glycoside hydrolase family 99-like domain-containing protein [Legionellales bacterium]